MATLTVGDGKTYSTIVAANAVANDGDTIEVYANVNEAAYAEGNITITKAITLVGMLPNCGVKITRINVLDVGSGGPAISGTVTIKNLTMYRSNFRLNNTSGDIVFEKCIMHTDANRVEPAAAYTRTGTYTFKNVLFIGARWDVVYVRSGSGGDFYFQFCTFLDCGVNALNITTANVNSVSVKNCDGIGAADAWGAVTGATNSSHNSTQTTNVCGTDNLTSKTKADADYFLNDILPSGIQQTSCLYGAGTPISGISDDIFGNTRNASTPSIGCFEGGLYFPEASGVLSTVNYNLDSLTGTYSAPNASDVKAGVTFGVGELGTYSEGGASGCGMGSQAVILEFRTETGKDQYGSPEFTVTTSTVYGQWEDKSGGLVISLGSATDKRIDAVFITSDDLVKTASKFTYANKDYERTFLKRVTDFQGNLHHYEVSLTEIT